MLRHVMNSEVLRGYISYFFWRGGPVPICHTLQSQTQKLVLLLNFYCGIKEDVFGLENSLQQGYAHFFCQVFWGGIKDHI